MLPDNNYYSTNQNIWLTRGGDVFKLSFPLSHGKLFKFFVLYKFYAVLSKGLRFHNKIRDHGTVQTNLRFCLHEIVKRDNDHTAALISDNCRKTVQKYIIPLVLFVQNMML